MKKLLLPTVLLFALGSILRAAPLPIGSAAPIVSGITDAGTTLNLGDVYKNNKYTLVYFYPAADTPGCTRQGLSLTKDYPELTKDGVAVVGVSVDPVAAQKSFKDKYKFPFPLIADTEKVVIKAFGQSGLNSRASREAYLIKDGKVLYHDQNHTSDQAQTVLDAISRDSNPPAATPAAPAAPMVPSVPSSPSTTTPAAK
jgi:peroxiredoxin Q/BCP